jgi:hypothetical protein
MVTVLRRRPHEYRPTTLANQAQSAPAKHKGIPDQPATDDAPREEAPPQPEPSADRNDDPHE